MARIVKFEGRSISVPDDATDDEVAAIIEGGAPPSTAPTAAPTPAEPSMMDNIINAVQGAGRVAYQGGIGASKGMLNMAGLPGALADALPPGALGPFSNMPSGEELQEIFRIDRAPKPQGPVETVVNRVGEEVGAMAVPTGAMTMQAVKKGLPAVREAGDWFSRTFLEPAAVNPANFIAKETGTAVASGTGAGLANLAVDRDTTAGQYADLAGSFGGVGLMSLGDAVLRAGGDVVAALTGNRKFASDTVKQSVTDTIIQNSDAASAQINPARPLDPIDTAAMAEAVTRPAPAETAIPGFRASTADRLGDAGLAGLENARAKGPTAGRYRGRHDANTEAIDNAVAAVAPTEPASTFRTALDDERDRLLVEAATGSQTATRDAEQIVAPLTPQSTPAARGNIVRTGLEDARDVARTATDDAYAAADINDVPVDPTDLASTIEDATANLTEVERGLVPEGVLARVRALGEADAPVDTGVLDANGRPVTREPEPADPVRMKQATDLVSELKRLRRAALADPRAEKGGRNAARVLDGIIQSVDTFVARNISPEQNAALETARGAKFDEAESFTRQGDPVAAALARNEGGVPKMRDERVAGTFVNPQNMDRLFAEADTPQVRTAIREEVLSRGDTSSVERIDDFIQSYGEQIDRFPGLRQEIETARAARQTQAAATGAEDTLRRTLGTPDGAMPGRGAVAGYLRFGDERAETAMQNVINAPQPAQAADELLTFVGDEPAAVEGARRAFWDVMESKSRSRNAAIETADGAEPWMTKKWRSFLNDPKVRAVVDRLYRDNPEHRDRLYEIADSLRTVGMGPRVGAATNPSGTAAQLRGGAVTMAEAQAKFIDVQRGRLSPLYAITYLAGKLANRVVSKQSEKAFQHLLDQALLDPDVAAELLKQNNPANRAALAKKAKVWLGNEANTILELIEGDEPQEGPKPTGEADYAEIFVNGSNPEKN
jgi:hypothetical protein